MGIFSRVAEKASKTINAPLGWLAQRVGDGGGSKVDRTKISGAYDGTDETICLATPIITPPVRVTTSLVGTPFFESTDENTQRLLDMFAPWARSHSAMLTRAALMYGTVWPWVRYNPTLKRVVVEIIGDNEVDEYSADRERQGITSMLVRYQQTKWYKGWTPNETEIISERVIDPIEIKERINGRQQAVANILGNLPIPMAVDEIDDNYRGVGIYSRIYPTAKALHNVIKRMVEVAGKYKPKLVQTLAYEGPNTATNWLSRVQTARGNSWKGSIDPLTDELFLNIIKESGADKTEMLYLPSDVFNGYIAIIDSLIHSIVLGSGMPELFWSQIDKTNYAGAEIAGELGVRYIQSVRNDLTDPWKQLAADYCKGQGYILGITPADFTIGWKEVDLVGATARAGNFSSWASAMSTMMGSKVMTKDTAFYFLKRFYPDAPVKNADDLESAMLEYANTIGALDSGEPTDAGWGGGLT